MPWLTPSLREVRTMVRDDVTSALTGAVMIGNSVLRVMSDANAGLGHLVLRYIDWLARQLLPDTAEVEWLDRHGDIWLVNADGSIGRKQATLASGIITMTGLPGVIIASGTQFEGVNVTYESIEQIVIGVGPTEIQVRAIDAGTIGNLLVGDTLSLLDSVPDVDSTATVVLLDGGVDDESDDLLRARVLFRIQKPPMGGDADDYILWTEAAPGVTRSWSYPNEMGIGTMTVRFMMDDLRATNNGYPLPTDIVTVAAYLDAKRPVTVKDMFVVAPIPYPYTLTISGLVNDNSTVRARILVAIKEMERDRVSPGQTLYRSWLDEAISNVVDEKNHELSFTTLVMPAPGYIAELGTIIYAS